VDHGLNNNRNLFCKKMWVLVALVACASGIAPGVAVVADATAIDTLFGALLNRVLSQVAFDSPFSDVPVGPEGRKLEGRVAVAGGVTCQGRYVAQTVPVGVLANASLCVAQVEVTWRVTQGTTVLCSNVTVLSWKAAQVLAYVAVGPGGGLAASRVEVNGGNTTAINTTCSSPASSQFVAQAAAAAIGMQLDVTIGAGLSVPPIPEVPDIVLNLTFTSTPVISRLNISAGCKGLFHQQSLPSPPPDIGCFAGAPPWSPFFAPANFGVRLFGCFWDSLFRELYDAGLFEGRLERRFLGLDLQLDISAAPLHAVLRQGSAALNATVRFEIVAGDDTGIIHAGALLPVNVSATADGTRLIGSVGTVDLGRLNVSFAVDQYRLPVDAALLRPLLLDVLQNELLPMFDRLLASGLALPFALPHAAIAVRSGYMELLAQV
jgi:hypothetical protein